MLRDSRKQWQAEHADYQKAYWQTHPQVAERNRARQRQREGDMPMSEIARQAFKDQLEFAGESDYLFPSWRQGKKPHLTNLRKIWEKTLERAKVPYFSLYELRHTFATRLSAGGVAEHFVVQMLRQGDAGVFKRCSQAKLNMMREALTRLDRQANEHATSGTGQLN